LKLSPPILIMAAVAIVVIMLAVILLMVDSARAAKQKRIDRLLKPYAPIVARAGESRDIRAAQEVTTLTSMPIIDRLLRVFGVKAEHKDLYPAPWWALLLALATLAAVISGLGVATFGNLGWLSHPGLFLMISRTFFNAVAAKRARVLYTQMPDALAMIVRSVRTGLPVSEALRIVGKEAQQPTGAEFERLYNQLLIGTTLTDALLEMARRTTVPEYRFFAVALALQGQTGGSLTDTLENLGDVIRKRTAMRARAYALSSEARTTMMVLASLPFVAFGALLLLTPQYAELLFETARGRQILAGALSLMGMGIGTMQLMIKRALT